MKRCPRCGQIYSDELLYCLQDGSELLVQFDEQETPTVVRRSPGPGASYLKYLAIALILILAIGTLGLIGAYIAWVKLSGSEVALPTPAPTPEPRPTTTPAGGETPANVDRSPSKVENRNPGSDKGFVDPGTTRITFRRGGVGETVKGWVNVKREFVLRTMDGQTLTAETSSELGCVVFGDGSSRTELSTLQGDTRLSVKNNCPAPVRFQLSVTVR